MMDKTINVTQQLWLHLWHMELGDGYLDYENYHHLSLPFVIQSSILEYMRLPILGKLFILSKTKNSRKGYTVSIPTNVYS